MSGPDTSSSTGSRGAAATVAVLLGLAGAGAVAFAVVVARGGNTQGASLTLGFTFAMLAAALVVWERRLMQHEETTEEIVPLPSDRPVEASAERTFAAGAEAIAGRRTWLVRLLGGVAGLIGISALLPFASFVPKNAESLASTSWRRGSRLVREDGSVVNAADLEIDSVVTVFPEGHVGTDAASVADMANAATVLIRVPPDELALGDRADWAPAGYVAYSKVCTHAGCPVALYRSHERQLFCPCHQSTFDVLRGAAVVFGPADRALPQLPIRVESDGTLVADGDFPEPIGPSYWERA